MNTHYTRRSVIAVGAGKTIDVAALAPDMKSAMQQGMADAWADFDALNKRVAAKEVTSGDLLGTRDVSRTTTSTA